MSYSNDHRVEVVVQESRNNQTPKVPSCVVCARRKVKCDRTHPCSSCARHEVECIYLPHNPPQRRKRRRSEGNHRRISLSRQSPTRKSNLASARISNVDHAPATHNDFPVAPRAEQGMLLTGEGQSIYLDSNLWSSVRGELPQAEDMLRDMSDHGSDQEVDNETSLILGGTVKKDLSVLHPSPLHIFKLWQTFLDNINPLTKILHGPTIQQQILKASDSLHTISTEFETLLFSIYCISLVSLREEDVQNTYGECKTTLLSRYRRAARSSFAKAGILRTSKIVVLQAFILYLLAIRESSDPHSVWSLCGLAVRMAQRIGLHRDGSELGLSPFETEMRRRLWRQLSILDVTTAQSSGITSQLSYLSADVRPPSNVNDSELDPRMTDTPRGHDGATEMIFVLARNEFGEWMRRWSKADGGAHRGRGFLTSSSLSLEKKDKAIDELNDLYQMKFLQYCDKTIPLHYMAARLMRAIVCQMRFTAHHPRQYGGTDRLSLPVRGHIFSTCLHIIESFEDCHSNELIQRFLWHVDNHIPWDALIYMLHELRTRIDEGETKRSWVLIDRVYSRHYEQMRNRPKSALHTAMHALILKAWKAHTEERARFKRSVLPYPHIISVLAENSERGTSSHRSGLTPGPEPGESAVGSPREQSTHGIPPDGTEVIDPSFELDQYNHSPLDWGQWDDLLDQFQQDFTNSELFTTDAS
ncbi:fungal-specific transcription factor domain-containing protein [Aspergillus alliaceus]|uniref:Fungal-specific transcription factor domain-containing protein n=1 Tax=Petromyces alliaceus TaxID=209559 RepID=A0A5N7C9W6_PETAA|nr:fungal-specific transcription factor domain-containing protein [Aspergillus alliaceus]